MRMCVALSNERMLEKKKALSSFAETLLLSNCYYDCGWLHAMHPIRQQWAQPCCWGCVGLRIAGGANRWLFEVHAHGGRLRAMCCADERIHADNAGNGTGKTARHPQRTRARRRPGIGCRIGCGESNTASNCPIKNQLRATNAHLRHAPSRFVRQHSRGSAVANADAKRRCGHGQQRWQGGKG